MFDSLKTVQSLVLAIVAPVRNVASGLLFKKLHSRADIKFLSGIS